MKFETFLLESFFAAAVLVCLLALNAMVISPVSASPAYTVAEVSGTMPMCH